MVKAFTFVYLFKLYLNSSIYFLLYFRYVICFAWLDILFSRLYFLLSHQCQLLKSVNVSWSDSVEESKQNVKYLTGNEN